MRVLLLLFFAQSLFAEIKILYTAALIDCQFEVRKEEYIYSLKALSRYGYIDKTYIVDSCEKKNHSFFERYAQHVFYAGTNNLKLINKGVNEAMAITAALDRYAFRDEDLLIKLTGRYSLESSRFLNAVETHPEIDLFVKFDQWGQAFTGCYAIRCKVLKELLRGIDLEELERQRICIETKVAEFIRKMPPEKVLILDQLDVRANIFGWGTPELTHW